MDFYRILTLIVLAGLLLFATGCGSTDIRVTPPGNTGGTGGSGNPDGTSGGGGTGPIAADEPCPNDPLVQMELAEPSPVSGLSGALFGCWRFGNDNCDLPVGDRPKRHRGIDLLADIGTPVYAMYAGTVIEARSGIGCDNVRSHGNRVIIASVVDSGTYSFFYCHLDRVEVRTGQTVVAGTRIGTAGVTGNACYVDNPHLHLEVQKDGRYFEPQEFLGTRLRNDGTAQNTCR